jgi:hypothetical protein
MSSAFDLAVQKATGRDVDFLRRTPVDQYRRMVETQSGRPIRFTSRFPLIGRGNILRGRALDHQKAEQAFASALRDE